VQHVPAESIVAGRALVDGNKRLGWIAFRLFYLMNGEDVRAGSAEAFDLVVAIASGELREVPQIAETLGRWPIERG
jgi:death-on-curing protein